MRSDCLEQKPKMVVVAGFHGSGKTTTIVRMNGKIRSELGKHVAIIVNDRTEIAVDGRTVKDLGFEVSEIAGGCVCIKVQDFTDSISSIIEKLNPDVTQM
ncbi:MAG: GTP-binding protein [Nitrososphaerales archaeon]